MKIYSAPTPLNVELTQEEASQIVRFLADILPFGIKLSAREVVVLDLYKQLSAQLVDY